MIGLLVVSHSPDAAKGIGDIARQMTGGLVPIAAVGGAEGGGLGTNPAAIVEALGELFGRGVEGIVAIPDLGSAVLACRSALEFLPPEDASRVTLADAPVLEGAMMAAVEASIGSDAAKVAATAASARSLEKLSR
jgi:dihydroxyacetone kinase phosphotransfer subunit